MSNEPYHIYPVGDSAACIQIGEGINWQHHAKLVAMQQWIMQKQYGFLEDAVIAYNSLTILYKITDIKRVSKDATAFEYITTLLRQAYSNAADYEPAYKDIIRIPVCYDEEYGIDLRAMSEQHGLSTQQIIALHAATTYRVYLIGFMPGFAYMGIVDDKIATPRRHTPRRQVAAGSVGIAGNQTGIYPVNSPGGWNIIGRTNIVLFDSGKQQPCLLQAGDAVNFYPVSKEEFLASANG
jgi:inhibitor of KinA